jgi:hypothetical protein
MKTPRVAMRHGAIQQLYSGCCLVLTAGSGPLFLFLFCFAAGEPGEH